VSLQKVSHYRVLRKLGEGGMGQVYLGQDLSLNRYVGIKFFSREWIGEGEGLARFRQEAQLASSINHPNVLTIYSIEEDEGELFIITEFVDGETLRQIIDRGPLSIAAAVTIALGIAEALVAAHAYWVVHRDIKPDNVMVRADGLVKVLDFGIAKLNDPALLGSDRGPSITMPGCVPGSLWYVAPERLRGEAAEPRSDIWSLGALTHEMLTGSPPFKGRNLAMMIDMIVNHEPAAIQDVRSDVPAELLSVIRRSLAKDPEVRYQASGDLVADLRRLKARLDFEDTK